MADTPLVLRKRTIQHPGFEFFETDLSIYSDYQQNTDALVVGFFAKGPILEPVALTDLNQYSMYFGTPSSEAEVYFYEGIKAVLDAGGSVTAVRLPYFNATCSYEDGKAEPQYMSICGSFTESTYKYAGELSTAYEYFGENSVSYKNIQFTRRALTFEELVNIKSASATETDTPPDFAIVNKYLDYVTDQGEELFVSVIGAGNVLNSQGLCVNYKIEDKKIVEIPAFTSDSQLPKTMSAISCLNDCKNNHIDEITDKTSQEELKKLYEAPQLTVCKPSLFWQSAGVFDENEQMLNVAQTYNESLLSYFPPLPTYIKSYTVTEGKEANDDTVYNIDRVYVDPKKDDFITVFVSKIKPSTLEVGKFTIEILEAFNGSIYSDSIDQASQESNFIGEIINTNSAYISYYGRQLKKPTDPEYSQEKSVILVTEMTPLKLSWSPLDGIVTPEYEEYNGEKRISAYNVNDQDRSGLTKSIVPTSDKGIDYAGTILKQAFDKVKNNIKYVFRDCYDFGLSSVITGYDSNKENTYNPINTVNPGQLPSVPAAAWQKIVRAFANFCQYKHKLSMFHADAPRQLVLNGNLSLIDDLRKNPEDVFKATTLQKLAIKNSTYMETNTQWYEIFNNFNYTKMWAPSSIFLAGNITRNDIQGNIWDAPAGHRYGVVSNVYRPAFNPSFEVQDALYLQCLNYGVAWPTGIITIEGQKTNYGEKSALNRINVRRLMIWMERYAQDQSAQFIYEPNNQITRDNYKAVLDLEYSRIKALGGITDYQVVCSAEANNPPAVVDDNEMRVTIKVIPTRTTEYILANFVICKTGTNLEEVSSMF
jgi:hypothetical protein